MILGLHPLLGFLPLLFLVFLIFRGKDLVTATFLTVVLGAIMTGQSLVSFGNSLVGGMTSFLAVIGFIVMLGAGIGKVLTNTGVAQTLVNFVLNVIGIKTQTRAIIAIMLSACVLTSVLGTSNGAIAILAPIIIPIASSLKLTKSSVGVLLHGAACTGLFLGPFTPPTVTTLQLTGLKYTTYLINVGLPVSLLIFAITIFMTKYIQNKTKDNAENHYTAEDVDLKDNYVPTKQSKFSALMFILSIIALVIYGTITNAGAAFAVVVIIISGIVVAVTNKVSSKDFVNWMIQGCTAMFGVLLAFVLCTPMIQFIGETGAFTALAEMLVPIANSAGTFGFAMVVTFVGVFGIAGAAVAQQQIIHNMFLPTVIALNFPMEIWALILLVGSQMTSFVMPGTDLFTPMSLARSKDVKSMLKNGYVIAFATIALVAIKTLFI